MNMMTKSDESTEKLNFLSMYQITIFELNNE